MKKVSTPYRKGLDGISAAFLIPDDQGDPARVAQLVARLMSQHIEVSRAKDPLRLKEGNFPAGTYVVRSISPIATTPSISSRLSTIP